MKVEKGEVFTVALDCGGDEREMGDPMALELMVSVREYERITGLQKVRKLS